MKYIIIALVLLLPIVAATSQDLYDIDNVTVVEIEFGRSDWDQVLDNYYAAGNEERLVATVKVNGMQFDSAGVRYKGNSTYNRNNAKNPFNIKLDYTHNDTYDGYGTLKLSNGFKDPSWVREVLSYEIARKYVPASRANYARVYINGNYHGLYASTQSVDKAFVSEHFHSSEHPRFKCNTDQNFQTNGGTALAWLGLDSTDYYGYYELKSDYGWTDLAALINGLNSTPERIEELVDIDRALWMLAFNNAFVNLDSYTGRGQNYYLYKDNDDRFSTTLWDLNECFGVFTSIGAGPGGGVDVVHFDPMYGQGNQYRPLLKIILANPRLMRKYMAHYRTLIEENIENGWYLTRGQELQSIIDEYVKSDGNAMFSYTAFKNNLTSAISVGGPGGTIAGVGQVMDARAAWLATQSEYTKAAPTVSEVNGSQRESMAVVKARVSDATDVTLHMRSTIGAAFDATTMNDSGQDYDEAAGDGWYTAAVPFDGATVQYYVYAENNEAGKFDPVRAEQEFYVLNNTGDVVINEFLASNDAIATDQDGEFDDWLELYNNSDTDIDLTGFHLSDDISVPDKWQFPAATIPAKGYLIVWCDDDEEQEGLHSSFKLSASGETISLYDPSLMLVDQVVFKDQSTDITTGRFPNGTGPFVNMKPTIGAENVQGTTSVVNTPTASGFSLEHNYPNPFNPATTLPLTLSQRMHIVLQVVNVHGQTVAVLHDGALEPGMHQFRWDAAGNPSGMYVAVLRTPSGTQMRTMIFAK